MAKKLRHYQEDIKSDIYNQWNLGYNNVLAVLPTGGGKTVTFCSVAMDFAIHPQNKLPTAIIVHRKELVQQISLTLSEEGVEHNIIAPRKTVLGIVAAQRMEYKRQFYNYSSNVTVVSVDTLNSRKHKYTEWFNKVKLWIVDEAAHLLKDNKWGKAVGGFADGVLGLGVTATPERLDGKGLGSDTDGVFDVMVEGPDVRWMIQEGHLCKYKVAIPKSEYESFLKKASNGSDFSKGSMIEAGTKSRIVGNIVDSYFQFAEGKQTIVFSTDVKTAGDTVEEFKSRGVNALVLTGESTDKERFEGMLSFRKKETTILVNVDLFDEGLDVPGIECVSMGRPTMSLGKYRQMVGRGLRTFEGKEHLILIDHVGNVMRHGLPDKKVTWSLDRRVKRRKTCDLLRICTNPECASPYERFLTECPFCGEKPIPKCGGGRVPPEMVDGDLELMDPETLRELDEAVYLEDPGSLFQRVSKAAGYKAAEKAKKNQIERINLQKDLVDIIANWAGVKKSEGYGDREIHKLFFIEQGKTINQALSEPSAGMLNTKGKINERD